MPFTNNKVQVLELRWYCDRPGGLEAAIATNAEQYMDTWPMARLKFGSDRAECDRMWRWILDNFKLSTMTYTRFVNEN
jgi:hypothetical protein